MLGFSAVNTGNNLLFLIVSGLLAFMSVTGLAGMINLKGLTPDLLPPAEIFAGCTTPFKLRINNTKRYLPSFLIRVECSGQSLTFPIVPSSTICEDTLALVMPQRGWSTCGTITISSPFPANFFTRFWSFQIHENFIVFPRLRAGALSGAADEQRPLGATVSHERGHDGELERIAAYSGREPLRLIHWKLSARGDELLVKEFGTQTAPPLVIDLERMIGKTLEERLSKAAWLVRRWVHQRPVGLVLCGKSIPAAIGGAHGRRLLKELALHGLD